MKIYQLSNGDELHRYKKSLVLLFRGKRKVLSTGPNNGGYRTDLQAVFNNDGNPGAGMAVVMRADTYEEHMNIIAREDLGLAPERCSGLCTAASMENVSIQRMDYEDFSVTAIVTGGVEHNGGRVGDEALWHEKDGTFVQTKPGTINILLHIDADLDEGTLVRTLVTCTEAKVAALQELLAPSRYSRGIATGSGTDGTIVICNPESKTRLTNAGKSSKIGEYIGKTVIAAVKEALQKQSGLCPAYQHDVIKRMDRFGVTEDTLWECYKEKISKGQDDVQNREEEKKQENNIIIETQKMSRAEFSHRLDKIKTDRRLVTYTSLYAHLLDQAEWGLLDRDEVWEAAKEILRLSGLGEISNIEEDKKKKRDNCSREEQKENCILWIIHQYKEKLVDKIMEE